MKIIKLSLIFAVIIVLSACIKEPDNVGLNVQPSSDRFYFFTDTNSTIKVSTFYDATVATDERSISLLGNINDDVFGRSSADLFTQLRLSADYPDGFGAVIPVSATLHLAYSGYYGDTTQQQALKIYELTKSLNIDSTYYSNNSEDWFDVNYLITDSTFTPNPKDSTLAITLPISIAEKILLADNSNIANNDAFIEYFKGLAIISDTTLGNSILYFDLISEKSVLRLEYLPSDTASTTLAADLLLNNNCARFNTFSHDYANSSTISNALADTVSEKVYIQAMGGVKTKLEFNLPADLLSKSIAINKAELIVKVDESIINDTYKVPEGLLIELIDDIEGFDAPLDYYLGGEYFNGKYNEETKSYTFNLNRHIQKIFNGEVENNGFYIIPSDNRVTANRVSLLNGVLNSMELIIYYTPL